MIVYPASSVKQAEPCDLLARVNHADHCTSKKSRLIKVRIDSDWTNG